MKCDKIQTGLRTPQEQYEKLRELAEHSGISLNNLILFLIDVGLSVVNLGIERSAHAELHIPQHTGGQ